METTKTIESMLSTKKVSLLATDKLQDALNLMSLSAISSVVIIDKASKPIGIVTEHDSLRLLSEKVSLSTKLGKLIHHPPFTIKLDTELHNAYATMEESGYHHLIVVDEHGVFRGVVTEGDFLRHFGFEHLSKNKQVIEAMRDAPVVLSSDTTLIDTAKILNERNCSFAIILEGLAPAGLITERDITALLSKGIDSSNLVSMFVVSVPKMVREDLPLYEAVALMEHHGVHQLIVVDAKKNLVGTLNRHDVLKAIHGAYFEFLLQAIEQKSELIENLEATKLELTAQNKNISQSELKFRTLFETLPDGALLVDGETMVAVEFNEQAHKMLGYSAKEFAKLKISDYEAVESIEVTKEKIKCIAKTGHDSFETIHIKKDGSLIDVWVKVRSITLDNHPYMFAVYRDITEPKQVREKIIKQNVLTETLFNTIPDLIWAKDVDGDYIACNKMFERFFNASESEILGKSDYDFVDKTLADFFRENDLKAIQAGGARVNEEYLVFGDGSYEGLFDTIKTPIKGLDGEILGVVGVARDVSLRKQQEFALSQIEHDLNAAQEIAHIGTWRLDVAKNELFWSDECYRIFGIDINTPLTYESFLSTIHPDDVKLVDEAWKRALKGASYDIVHRIITNQSIRWVQEHAVLETDENGELARGVGTVQDVTQQKVYEFQLENLANFDHLTGLANRGLITSQLSKQMELAKGGNTKIALVMFDLDRFKNINDSFGHEFGDELLIQIAKRLKSNYGKEYLLSRLGGDEFAIVMPSVLHDKEVDKFVNALIELIEEPFELASTLTIHISMSVGVVIYPEYGMTAQSLFQYADAALYKAKNEGGGSYSKYSELLTEVAKKKVEIEKRIRDAITNNYFEVYYQPQVFMATNKVIGAEALVRLVDPVLGVVPPSDFITIAEETGLIAHIGEWVLNQTCKQGKMWHDKGYRVNLAVNLSPYQVKHQNIPNIASKALSLSGFPASKLELELTESSLINRELETVEMMHSLRALGIKLAIDDFGTGYSSLSYLKRFPIDVLKIDKSFVDDIPYDNDDIAIVKAIVALGKALGFGILAEGVETKEQLSFLKENGCDMYQGYLKSKPLRASEFEAMLEECAKS